MEDFNDSVENSATNFDSEEINIKTRRSQQKPKQRITIWASVLLENIFRKSGILFCAKDCGQQLTNLQNIIIKIVQIIGC